MRAPLPTASTGSAFGVERILGVALTAVLHVAGTAVLVWQTSQPVPLPPRAEQPRGAQERSLTVVLLSQEQARPTAPVPPMPQPPQRPRPAAPTAKAALPPPPMLPPQPVAAVQVPAPLPVAAVTTAALPPVQLAARTPAPAVADAARQGARAPARVQRDQHDYVRELMDWLVRYRVYPDQAKREKAQGIVHVRFTIDRAGRVLSAEVERGPGIASLESAALQVLASASPVPAIPSSMQLDRLTITLPIEYSLRTQ